MTTVTNIFHMSDAAINIRVNTFDSPPFATLRLTVNNQAAFTFFYKSVGDMAVLAHGLSAAVADAIKRADFTAHDCVDLTMTEQNV